MERSVLITNIGQLVSGRLDQDILGADTILVRNGKIVRVGNHESIKPAEQAEVIDAGGMVVMPGLIDSHAHMVIGDWTPRHNAIGWMEGALHGGVTTMISKGESHTQGLPRDPAGVKALSILARKAYENFRPGGMKVHGGALILVKGLQEKDFKELADCGVRLLAEVGVGERDLNSVIEMVSWAKKYGMKVPMHCGGPSIPGSMAVTAKEIMAVNPDIVAHINGGCTAPSLEDVKKLLYETRLPLEVVHNGNSKVMHLVIQLAKKENMLGRIHIGSETPVGSGLGPTAVLRTVIQISSLNELPASKIIAMATGNTAEVYGLDTGVIEEGREADLLIIDSPPNSVGEDALKAIEAGDTPGIAMIMVDGEIVAFRGRNTPPTTRRIKVNGVEKALPGLEEYLFGRR